MTLNSAVKPNRLKVTVMLFHPFLRRSQNNRILWESIQGIDGIETRDMYSLYPDFSFDVEAEQAIISNADVLVFQHPFYWYNCPALMKEWIDTILERGWAYGPGGGQLTGKSWLQVITTGGQDSAYHRSGGNRFSICEFLRPFEQTALLCGMNPLNPFLTQGVSMIGSDERIARGLQLRNLLIDISNGNIPHAYTTSECEEVSAVELQPEIP